MIRQLISGFLIIFLGLSLNAQQDSLNQEVAPKGGVNNLAVKYYGIDFTKEQRQLLKDKEVELIFQVDSEGKHKLSEVNGISDKEIIDSLKQKTKEVENFLPRIRNGIAEPSIYFIKFEFPTYNLISRKYGGRLGSSYNEANSKILNISINQDQESIFY